MKGLSQYLKQQFNTLKGFEIYDYIFLISKWPFMFLQLQMVKNLIVLKPMWLCEYVACVFLHTNEAVNR